MSFGVGPRRGRTGFVPSHLISEMSLTADRLFVIGRGRLIAETTVADFVVRSGPGAAIRRRPAIRADQDLTKLIMSTVNQGRGGTVQPLSPALGLLLMAIFAAIALGAGVVVFLKRDA